LPISILLAFTGRQQIWTLRYRDRYLIILIHPNVAETLLVFCPFISSAPELLEQVEALCKTQAFLSQFQNYEILLARVPEVIAEEIFSIPPMSSLNCRLERVDENRLDWVYPSYDIELRRLLAPQGRALKSFKKKLRKFSYVDIELFKPMHFSAVTLSEAVSQVNKGWIRTKLKSRIAFVSPRELMSCYRTVVDLSCDASFAIDGLILRRGGSYLAFAFWERPAVRRTVSCVAALPVSHEKGLSEYLYYLIAKCLVADGYNEMCIGGSETASLDRFKRKLDPSRAHKLFTVRILLRTGNARFG
jgi:hypothetical protein